MRIPLAEMAFGCSKLTAKVRSHAEDAWSLYEQQRYTGAFIMMSFGFEELGKLIEYIQAAGAAEKIGQPWATVTDIYWAPGKAAHRMKASVASNHFKIVVDIVAHALRDAGVQGINLVGYSDHLLELATTFPDLRKAVMYVDYKDGAWSVDPPQNVATLGTDISMLRIAAVILQSELGGHKAFQQVVDDLATLGQSSQQELPGLFREIKQLWDELSSE